MRDELLYGRWFTKNQLSKEERIRAQKIPVDKDRCVRCGTVFQEEAVLPNGSSYCRECILLGRITSQDCLYAFPQETFLPQSSLLWQGQLTDWQKGVSEALCQQVAEKQPSLVHAVTGAGKTEMIYQVVAQVIDQGGTVCLASPRVDVCIELYKRLSQDFACPIALLHGGSEPYFRTPLVIATTHQLLKFYQAFDLLLIDEVDAFPYVDNPVLYRAVNQAIKPEGVPVFLTATSTDELDRKVRKGELRRLSLPRRFHGNPLIVPQKVWMRGFLKQLEKGNLLPLITRYIQEQRKTGYPLLIFSPEIKTGRQLAAILEKRFPQEKIGFVSSRTDNRLELVDAFRARELSILVATTILERGVTFPGVDVFVLEAHHVLYTRSSLVQIAGRVGRSPKRPTGQLLYFIEENNRAIESAIAEIKQMNQEAGHAPVSTMSRT